MVMNVITYDRAYSLYPLATFEAHVALYCKNVEQRDAAVIAKYRARGYAIYHGWPAVDPFTRQPVPEHLIPLDTRWIGDR